MKASWEQWAEDSWKIHKFLLLTIVLHVGKCERRFEKIFIVSENSLAEKFSYPNFRSSLWGLFEKRHRAYQHPIGWSTNLADFWSLLINLNSTLFGEFSFCTWGTRHDSKICNSHQPPRGPFDEFQSSCPLFGAADAQRVCTSFRLVFLTSSWLFITIA